MGTRKSWEHFCHVQWQLPFFYTCSTFSKHLLLGNPALLRDSALTNFTTNLSIFIPEYGRFIFLYFYLVPPSYQYWILQLIWHSQMAISRVLSALTHWNGICKVKPINQTVLCILVSTCEVFWYILFVNAPSSISQTPPLVCPMGPPLLTWINFNSSMDK